MTKLELADMLERFLADAPEAGAWDFDDFTSVKAGSELEPYRQRLMQAWGDGWNDEAEVRNIIRELKTDAQD